MSLPRHSCILNEPQHILTPWTWDGTNERARVAGRIDAPIDRTIRFAYLGMAGGDAFRLAGGAGAIFAATAGSFSERD